MVWLAVLSGLAATVCAAVSDVNFSSNFHHLRDPVMPVAPLGTAYNAATGIQALLFLAGAAALIARFRRSGQEQRLQLKWFMYAAAVAAVVVVVASALIDDSLPEFDIVVPLVPAAVLGIGEVAADLAAAAHARIGLGAELRAVADPEYLVVFGTDDALP